MSETTQSNLCIDEIADISDHHKTIDKIIGSLKTLLDGDEQEQRETFAFLQQSLDEDRPSTRNLF
ncbi:MAG: hypothetical protein C4527_01455 [Candidatus Omnitrophota bacterium]|jgi:hypothetical protein|nr:MAG: hypothetical protein C4527_01455 [Candidatus Omnitrophota bacterium]